MDEPSAWWIGLRAALSRLAAPAEEQAAYLRDLGVEDLLDELALEYGDYLLPTQTELNDDEHARGFLASCRTLDALLNDAQLGWRAADLDSDAWQRVRGAAQIALTDLDRIWPTAE